MQPGCQWKTLSGGPCSCFQVEHVPGRWGVPGVDDVLAMWDFHLASLSYRNVGLGPELGACQIETEGLFTHSCFGSIILQKDMSMSQAV